MSRTLEYKALLFDLGGVVLRLNPERVLRIWSNYGDAEFTEVASKWQIGEPYKLHEIGEINFIQLTNHLANLLGIEMTQDQWLTGWNALFDGVFEDVVDRLALIAHKMPIYAYTNTNREHSDVWSLRYAEELSSFKRIYVSSEIHKRKPDISSFQWVAEDMGYSEQDIFFFDDNIENIMGAKRAGMHAQHVDDPQITASVLDKIILTL